MATVLIGQVGRKTQIGGHPVGITGSNWRLCDCGVSLEPHRDKRFQDSRLLDTTKERVGYFDEAQKSQNPLNRATLLAMQPGKAFLMTKELRKRQFYLPHDSVKLIDVRK